MVPSERKGLEELGTNMLDKSWHDRKTADDDACRKLSPAPKTHELQIVGFVSGFWHLKAVIGAHNRRYASTLKD